MSISGQWGFLSCTCVFFCLVHRVYGEGAVCHCVECLEEEEEVFVPVVGMTVTAPFARRGVGRLGAPS